MTMSLVPRLSRKHEHFLFGIIQSGLTAGIASGIANGHLVKEGTFVLNWITSWFTSWIVMVPIVLFAAPAIRRLVTLMTHD